MRGEEHLMHELALCQAIVDTVARHAEGQRVERVEVRIGHFRQVVPDSLLFSWELLVDGTDLSGCTLAIEHVPAVVECRSCGGTSTLDLPILVCAECGSTEVELVSGEEFLIASIDRAKEVC
jgi:hydrogenase nickel incorporation protein HypA/HybF